MHVTYIIDFQYWQ